jgi:hypothetical protein
MLTVCEYRHQLNLEEEDKNTCSCFVTLLRIIVSDNCGQSPPVSGVEANGFGTPYTAYNYIRHYKSRIFYFSSPKNNNSVLILFLGSRILKLLGGKDVK